MATTLRALVMLSVLVALPAAWVYYGPLPAPAQRVVEQLIASAQEAVRGTKADAATGQLPSVAPAWLSSDDADPAVSAAPVPGASQESTSKALGRRLEPLLLQLRQLGAAEYALEPWGDGLQLFRFRCEMPLATSGEATQQFEAISEDPQATVEQVLAEIASWSAARVRGG